MDTEVSWEELEAMLQGCVMLIGLTFVDENEQVIAQHQTHGVFERFSEDGLMQIRKADGDIFQMVYDPESILQAAPGDYRERSTGITITDPDYLVRWIIHVQDQSTIEETRQKGFVPPTTSPA